MFTTQEKLGMFSRSIFNSLPTPRQMDRLLEALAVCAWADHERHRILDSMCQPLVGLWARELCDLSVALRDAGIELERALLAEHRDYGEELVYHAPTPVAVLHD